MIRLVFTLGLLLCYIFPAHCQQKIAGGNVTAVRSIDPSDTDYTDLRAIASAIGDARLVMDYIKGSGIWPEVMDGLFFIKHPTPVTRAQ
jgi:hypothetical protein